MGKPALALLTIHATLLSQVGMAHLPDSSGALQRDKGVQSVGERLDRMKLLMDRASHAVEGQQYRPDRQLMQSVQFRSCGAGNWWRC